MEHKYQEGDVRHLLQSSESSNDDSDSETRERYGTVNIQNKESHTFEEAIDAAGFGLYHYMLLCVCGWANASDAVEMLCVSFLMPQAKTDMHLTGLEEGWLSATIFVGMMVGSYFWGALGDVRGRKAVLVYSLFMNGFFGLASSFMQSYVPFLFMRFLSGIGVGGSMPVIFAYFCEFQPKKRRGAMLTAISMFWILGNVITAGLAWIIIPRTHLGYFSEHFTFNSWRIFVVVCTLPSFTSSLSFAILPESPKFLLENGQETQALNVLRSVFLVNNRKKKKTDYFVKILQPSQQARKRSARIALSQVSFFTKIKNNFLFVISSTKQLFLSPYLLVTLNLLGIIFSLAFGYYGLWLWFPELFLRVEQSGGSACSELSPNVTINTNNTDNSVYRDAFITAAANVPGNLFATLTVDKLGRKVLLCGSLLISGASVFFIWFLNTKIEVLAMSCIFGGVSVISWAVLNVVGAESYPTNMRSTALGVQSLTNRIGAVVGNVIFGVFIDLHCAVPILSVAILLAFAGIITLRLPNTKKTDLL
ncbi:synaptic vesicle glycoprotein 2B-like [Saccoglossus kowalevskii]|uniref:Synaptic vesicle glycoprotein 2B-like n=1 Tax=Saccoglossus kowalevskii TaxID=10224 RepID=A0ABM0GP57_SACKO|nr:PREDICTED: synaptic vesicle glycoprotein 2B-like [Saccoglossus kowalevskii]